MIYKLHYWFGGSGANVFSVLIGVFIETYTDATPGELGTLLMVIPFLSIIFRPIICSTADRKQAHRKYLLVCLFVTAISYSPFVIIPLLGESVYRHHPRTCWYMFMGLKVIGDVAWGGSCSIVDSLAINYAKRIGTSFTVYRCWGTISWMFFGLVIGQVNEIDCMPKYVPGFMILIVAALLDCFFIWLWPREYFEMSQTTASGDSCSQKESPEGENKTVVEKQDKKTKKKENAFTKSLMPKEVIWAQAKQKLLRVICCGRYPSKTTSTEATKTTSIEVVAMDKVELEKGEKDKQQSNDINKMTQVRILMVLFRRDPRISLYYVYFMFGGASIATLSFFFINLSDICHNQGTCNFSQLAGLLQVAMSSLETLLFIYIGRVMAKCGRVNVAALAMLFAGLKFTFYGTIWTQVSPYYSLIAEGFHGLIFGIFLTLMVEMGHLFASEVQYIIPELLERGIIPANTDTTKLKYSLAATMQAVISSAFDGLGRGLGALTYGILLDSISFQALWLLVGITGFVLFTVILAINVVGTMLGLRLGLDVKANDETQRRKLAGLEVPAELPVVESPARCHESLGVKLSIGSLKAAGIEGNA